MRGYFFSVIGGALAVVLAKAVFIATVDPIGRLGWNHGGIYFALEREQKESAVKWRGHDAVFFTNSKLSMQDPAELDAYRWFNFAAGGMRIEEMAGFVEAYVRDQSACVLGLDVWMMHAGHPPVTEVAHPRPWFAWLPSYLTSWRSFFRTTGTLQRRWAGVSPVITSGGFLDATLFAERLARKNIGGDAEWDFWFEQNLMSNFVYCEKRLTMLKQIRDTLKQRGVKLVVFLHPQHEQALQFLERPEFAAHQKRFLKDLRGIFPVVVDLTKEYPDDRFYFTNDRLHYFPWVSTEFLNARVIPLLEQTSHDARAMEGGE